MYRLSNQAIAHIARLLQLAILDGTDVTAHMQGIHFDADANGYLCLNAEYEKTHNDQIDFMLRTAPVPQSDTPES